MAEHVLKGGRYSVMRQNKSNGVIAMGTEKGVVEWWTPGVGNACVKVFVGGKVDDVGFYKGYMYTAAEKVKVWDMRMLKVVEELEVGRGVGLDVSDRGVLAVGLGWRVEMWKDLHVGNCGKEEKLIGVGGVDVHKNENESKNKESKLPYMKHSPASWTNTRISNLQFVPF